MSTETNKELVRRLFNEFYVRRNEAVWDELAHPDVVIHGVQGTINGTDAAKALYTTQFFAALQPWTFRIDDMIAERDQVVVRITESGTMVGSFMGMAPTGRTFTIPAVQICRIAEGKLVEMWGFRDSGSLLRQLGLTAPPVSASR
jgi:predicted ester cyclase